MGNVAHGLANNSMTDAHRAALSPGDPEYQARYFKSNRRAHQVIFESNANNLNRAIGSKIQVAGWTTYVLLIGSLKLSMLAFYVRLTV